MATVSERSQELLLKLMNTNQAVGLNNAGTLEAIGQALLAERRLAMEEAAKIAGYPGTSCRYAPEHLSSTCYMVKLCAITAQIAAKLRAAAEKEVGK